MRQVLIVISLLSAQFHVPTIPKPEHPQSDLKTLPRNEGPDEATMKAEFAKSVAEVGEIFKMAEQAKAAFDKAEPRSLPADALKLLGEIEKRAKRVRGRFKR